MTFSVSYRSKDGAMRTEVIDAVNRGECIAKCKSIGISPVRVEASNGKKATPSSSSDNRLLKSILVGFVTAAICTGVWLYFKGDEQTSEDDAKPKTVKTPSEKKTVPARASKPVKEAPPKTVTAKDTPSKKEMTLEEREAMIEKKIMEIPLDLTTKTNRAFSTGLEQKLAAIFTTELGAPPPLLPTRLSPVTFLKLEEILDAPNEILETDSDRVIEAKKACTQAKKMMKEHIAAGGDPEKFLESYYSMLKQASEEWKTAQMSLMQTIHTDPGLAITMEAEINENFTARGIRPVKIPPQFKERYGIK